MNKEKRPINQMTVHQEFLAKTRQEPVLTSTTEITPSSVGVLEADLATLSPNAEAFDPKMRDYFVFLSRELWEVMTANETGELVYPRKVYNGEVANLAELREKIIAMAIGERKAVSARGAGRFDQMGDHFWNTSKVEDLGEIKIQLDTLISLAQSHFGVDPMEFINRTTGVSR